MPVVDNTIGLTPELPADALVPATAAPAVESAPAATEPAPAVTESDPAAAAPYPATDEEAPRGFLDESEPVAPPAAEEAAATGTEGAAEATPAPPEATPARHPRGGRSSSGAGRRDDRRRACSRGAPAAAEAAPETIASPAGDAATSAAEDEVESWVVTLASDLDNAIELAASESEAAITVNGFLDQRQFAKFRGIEIKGGNGRDRLRIDSTARFIESSVTFDGGDGLDGVEGPSTDTTWTIDGKNSGSVAGVAFSSVEDLQGAADNEDTFVFEEGGSVSGVVDGGAGGSDRLFLAGSYASAEAASTGEGSGTVTVDGVVIRFAGLEQPALNADGAPISAGAAGALDAATLAAVAGQAAELRASRAGPGDAAPPDGITFAIADLPGATLAQSYGRVVTVDSDAAGWGWYVEGSPVHTGGMDLLTAVLHGLGRASGLDESAADVPPEMAGTLAPRGGGASGRRRRRAGRRAGSVGRPPERRRQPAAAHLRARPHRAVAERPDRVSLDLDRERPDDPRRQRQRPSRDHLASEHPRDPDLLRRPRRHRHHPRAPAGRRVVSDRAGQRHGRRRRLRGGRASSKAQRQTRTPLYSKRADR